MTAKEFVSRLAPVELERLALIFNWLGSFASDLRLENGSRLNDATDWACFFQELASACKFSESTEVHSGAVSRTRPEVTARRGFNLDFCPDCGHVHVDDEECGFPIGGGRICRCERAVPA